MAQRAFVHRYLTIAGTSNLNEMSIEFEISLLEETVNVARQSLLMITTQWSDNIQQIETKIKDAIIAEARANNYNTLTTNDIMMVQFHK